MQQDRAGRTHLPTSFDPSSVLLGHIGRSPLGAVYPPPGIPVSGEEILQYNNLVGQNRELYEDNRILLCKLEKYEKLEPYINTLIATNAELEGQAEQLRTQNAYLSKSVRELHVQNKNDQDSFQEQVSRLNQLIQTGKDNGNRVRLENESLAKMVRVHVSEIEQYKRKLEEAITDKIHQEQLAKQVTSQRDKLVGEIKQLENYNKQIAKNWKLKQDQLMEKLESRERTIKTMEKEREELVSNLHKAKEEQSSLQAEITQMGRNYQTLSANHEALLNEYRANSLNKAELQQLFEESLQKIGRREEQLKEIQMFRDEEKEIYQQEFIKTQFIFEQQKQQYQQALHHQSLEHEHIVQAYHELRQTIQQMQRQNWEVEGKLEAKTRQLLEKNHQMECKVQQLKSLSAELQQSQCQGLEMRDRMQSMEAENCKLRDTLLMFDMKYQQRENQFEDFVKDMRAKFENEKAKWEELFQVEKSKLKRTHEYQKKQVQNSLNTRILMLETEIEDYRDRLCRTERQKTQKGGSLTINKAIVSEHRIATKPSKVEEPVEKRLLSDLNQGSGTKTARHRGSQ